ncbi:hypothetical protein NDU88_002643 [Pleurodeles waltl]|uniref:Uncharacterized protein n=1 Tax=Pleurodeles waltl TaxID=8319 RepID=A0AAV7NEA7_PLEWA|nr:hypothetical protein NDU88_002643 [Pleurodeles waltl]
MLLAQEEGQYLQCVAGFVRGVGFRSKGLRQPPVQQRFVRGRNGNEGPQCACRVSRGSISATDSHLVAAQALGFDPGVQAIITVVHATGGWMDVLGSLLEWKEGPRCEPCTHCQGGSHRWRCVVESFQLGIHVRAIFLKDVLKGMLVERKSRTGPLRPHASSAVCPGGTSLQRECFPCLPGRQQVAAPQRVWGLVGAAPRVTQGEPSKFGVEHPSVTG